MGVKDSAKNIGGRPVGSKSKLSQRAAERLDAMNCDPLEGMARIAEECIRDGDRALAGAMYKELAKYVAPQLKSVEYKVEGDVKHDHAFSIQFIAPTTNYIDSSEIEEAKLIE